MYSSPLFFKKKKKRKKEDEDEYLRKQIFANKIHLVKDKSMHHS